MKSGQLQNLGQEPMKYSKLYAAFVKDLNITTDGLENPSGGSQKNIHKHLDTTQKSQLFSEQLASHALLNRNFHDIRFQDSAYAITFCSLKPAISSRL
jgi:hypothetical protein